MLAATCALAIVAACRHARGLRVQNSTQDHAPEDGWQPLETGSPYDFDDVRRDESVTQAVRSLVRAANATHVFSEATMVRAANAPHFFSEADCSIFTSAKVCAGARAHVTYLTSYPCSGNTWMRSLLEQTLLIYTGAVFLDPSLRAAGMLGEGLQDPGKVFPVKTHWPVLGDHTEGGGVKNLAIVREPLHSTLSYTQWLYGGGNHSREIGQKELGRQFRRHARSHLRHWALMARTYKGRSDTHVVRYEDLVANTRGVMLRQILPFLGVNASHPDVRARLDAAVVRSNNAFTTTRRKHTYTFRFTYKHKALMKAHIPDELLRHYGYRR